MQADGRRSSDKVSVAVIGAGIGGSAASYFLRDTLDEHFQAKIVVFDAAEKVGGRTDVSENREQSEKSAHGRKIQITRQSC